MNSDEPKFQNATRTGISSTLDLSILVNGGTSFAISCIFLIIFLVFRKKFKYVYRPNEVNIK